MDTKNKNFFSRLRRRVLQDLRWLAPGLGVKRWLGLVLAGTTLIGVGSAILLLEIYRTTPDTWWLPLLSYASLRILARPVRVLIFGGLGLGLILGGIWGLNRAVLTPFLRSGRPVVDTLTDHRRRERGPRVVVIGGGHGLSMLLRGLKAYTHRLTAVVTVADDGGSSGRLRQSLGILPPGDIRNCLAALSNDEDLLTQLFQYRFANGAGGLDGHSFGNLFISALSEITGSFEDAIAESGRVLTVHGRVLPASLHDVRLAADIMPPDASQEVRVEGESHISKMGGRVRRVWLEPNDPPAFPKVIQAILSADLIIAGPGSLYTSVLPNLLVPDIAAALRASSGFKVYVCNVATQPGETQGFTCHDHVQALDDHVGGDLFDMVVQNNSFDGKLPEDVQWVTLGNDADICYPVYQANLTDDDEPWHHNSEKMASVLIDLLQARTGPLAE